MEEIGNESTREFFQTDIFKKELQLDAKHQMKLRNKKYIFLLILIILIILFVIIIIIFTLNRDKKIICEKGFFIPNDDLTNCVKCSDYCEKCSGTKNNSICHYCKFGFYLINGKCIRYSFKAVYQSFKENENVRLIGLSYLKYLEEMYIDNKTITPLKTSFNFSSPGNHTVFIYINISNLSSFSFLFSGVDKMTSISFSPNFNTKNIESFQDMFKFCSSLTSLDISNFDTSNLQNMEGTFKGCYKLTSINITHFKTAKVNRLFSTFESCSSLTSLDLSNFDTSEVTNMGFMFYNCSSLTSLDVSKFNTSKLTTMQEMFYLCSSLKSINLLNFNTSSLENIGYLFSDCYSLTSIDLSNFHINTIELYPYIFKNCIKLTYIDISSFTELSSYQNTIFHNISDFGTIKINEKIKDQIKVLLSNWNIIY